MIKLPMFAIMLPLIVLAPSGVSAATVDQGNKDCTKFGGHMVWNWFHDCPWCFTSCFKCLSTQYCIAITCDLKECDETVIERRAGKGPRIIKNFSPLSKQ
jgi:hypothetical protein